MDLFILREADRSPVKPLDVCPEIEIPTFYLPCQVLADRMHAGRYMPTVGPPVVRVVMPNGSVPKKPQQFLETLVGALPIDPGQDDARALVHGIPGPALVVLAAHIGPELIGLRSVVEAELQAIEALRLPVVEQIGVHLRRFFLSGRSRCSY